MIGGDEAIVRHLDPIFNSLAPGAATAPRTPGATGEPTTAENGYLLMRPQRRGTLRENGSQWN
jgi:6-phosphogluconate dehydrogenase